MKRPMTLGKALRLADYYGGDQAFEDERDQMSEAMAVLAGQLRKLGEQFEREAEDA